MNNKTGRTNAEWVKKGNCPRWRGQHMLRTGHATCYKLHAQRARARTCAGNSKELEKEEVHLSGLRVLSKAYV